MKSFVCGFVILSLALNIFLWNRLSNQGSQLKSAQAGAAEIDEMRQQNQELQTSRTSALDSVRKDTGEMARLLTEVAQLRRRAWEAERFRTAAAEAEQLRAQLATVTADLSLARGELGDAAKLPPEQLQQLITDAQSMQCVNNLKRIGLAARLWANDHNDVFPPDLVSMKAELSTPRIFFCPADPAAVRVAEWSQLNPSSISYRFLNPNGNESDPTRLLSLCPIHGHVGLSDGSVQRR